MCIYTCIHIDMYIYLYIRQDRTMTHHQKVLGVRSDMSHWVGSSDRVSEEGAYVCLSV